MRVVRVSAGRRWVLTSAIRTTQLIVTQAHRLVVVVRHTILARHRVGSGRREEQQHARTKAGSLSRSHHRGGTPPFCPPSLSALFCFNQQFTLLHPPAHSRNQALLRDTRTRRSHSSLPPSAGRHQRTPSKTQTTTMLSFPAVTASAAVMLALLPPTLAHMNIGTPPPLRGQVHLSHVLPLSRSRTRP